MLANAVPTASLVVPPTALLGSAVNFTVGFANTSPSQAGYGPYVDLELPSAGNNGITFGSANFLGAAVTSTVLTFDASGHATHPYAKDSSGNPVVINGAAGDQLVVLQLPFGSYTPGQPEADISVAANLSNLATPGSSLTIKADGGFRYGNDALDNPSTDPSIIGASVTAPVSPTLVTVKATYLGPEQETASGPNFKQQYRITATVAPGQTISNFALSDILPAGLQFVSLDASSANGSSSAATTSTPSTTAPGGTLARTFDKVVGTGGASDASMTFTFYAPRDAPAGTNLLNLANGASVAETDQAKGTGTWTAPATGQATAVSSATASDTIAVKSIAIQEGVADLTHPGLLQPGDTLEHTLTFQLSDFFAVQNAIATEMISDGQLFDTTFAPTLAYTQHGSTSAAAAFAGADYSVGSQDTTTGVTTAAFRISAELVARAFTNGQLLGGSIPNGGTGGPQPSSTPAFGGTTGTIVYRTVAQQRFTYNYPSGEPYLDEGDQLTTSDTISGGVLAYSNLNPDGSTTTDGTGTTLAIRRGTLTESIYAINGNTSVGANPKIAAGDAVTYRIQYVLPTSNVETMALQGFIPLPIFDATTVTAFDDTTGAAAPASGHAHFGPADTYRALSNIVPTLATSSTSNSLTFTYGTYHDPGQRQSTVDLLYTVTASNKPFADGLFLTTQAHETEGSTNQGSATANALVQVQLTEPVLAITKGVVAVDNPHATVASNPYNFSAPGSAGFRAGTTITSNGLTAAPITGTVTNFDASDLVTFAVVVQNTGTGLNGAYDVTLKDILPAGFVVPAGGLNLSVTDGTGAALTVSNVGGGSGLFDQGIVVKNPNGTSGTLAAYSATSGRNILVLTYDLQASPTIAAKQSIVNTASLTNYSATEGGPDFLTAPATATATATVAPTTLAKALTATNQSFTAGSNLAIGEIATYTVTLTLPEGTTPSASLVDTLPAGLAIVGIDSITPSSGQVTSSNGSWSSVLANNVTIGSNGSSATFNLGTITDSDTNNNVVDTLTIVYRVVALNVSSNVQATGLTNAAALTYTGGSATASAAATVLVPKLALTASADKSSVQAGDTITYTFTIANLAANGSGTDAYDVNLADALPIGLTIVSGSLANTAGTAPTSMSSSGGNIAINFARLALGASSTFTVQATVDSSTGAYQTLTNPFSANYTTLPGNVTAAQSTYNANSTERTGNTADPGGTANNLIVARSVAVNTAPPAIAEVIGSTNLATLSAPNVTVGEQVQYQLTLTIPDGTDASSTLTDVLPAGMAFIGVNSITASSSLSTSASGGFSGVASSASITNNGGTLSLNFGTITNTDRNPATAETIVVTYTAVVLNVAGNAAGTTLQDQATFATQGNSINTRAAALQVKLPVLAVAVAADKATAQAGDTITYTVVVTNSAANGSSSDAYDVNLSDLLPAGLTYVAGSLTNTAGTAPTSIAGAGSPPAATFNDLALGGSSTFTFRATVDSSTGPYQTLTDSATASYSTLPGNVTTAQSSYNANSTERTGNTADPGGTANNLRATGTASTQTTLPNLGKVIVGTSVPTTSGSNVAIGEKVQYQVTIAVPDGVTSNATLVDTLPAGLAIVSLDGLTYSPTLSSSQSGGFAGVQSSATVGTNGGSLSLNFGTITNSNRDTTQSQSIVVTYTAVVLNVAGNVAGTTLTNAAVFAVQGGSTSAATPVTVVEPRVGVALSAAPGRGDANGPAITFTAVITAASGTGADAYDAVFSDLLPAGYTYVVGSLASTAGVAPTSTADSGGRPTATYADLAPGATSTLTFRATLSAATTPGQSVADTANLAYTSLPGAVTAPESPYNASSTERTGSTSDPGGAANTYAATSTTSVMVNSNTIAGAVFEDINDDGTIGGTEPGIGGVTVALTGVDNLGNAVNLTTTTAASGAYSFAGLRPGSYNLAMAPPAGYLDGKDTVGTPFGGTIPAPDHVSGLSIPLGVNAAGAGYNFGELKPSRIAGQVYSDLNNNGAVDPGEPGIAGATITLTGTDDLGNAVNTALTTDAGGLFGFNNLRPGTYQVAETQPNGYLQGQNAAGKAGGTFSGDVLSGIVLVENQGASGILYGELAPATLAGTAYLDSNDDGVKGAGEPGVGGVVVTLTGTDDLGNAVNLSAGTGTGAYSFGGLRPGTYRVTAGPPSGLIAGKAAAGNLGGAVLARDAIGSIPLAPGSAATGYNLGFLPPATLSGSAFVDANDDGIRQAGEAGIGSAAVTLTGTDDLGNAVALTIATGADGSYSFGNLEPGTYAVSLAVPAGSLPGKAGAGTLGGNASAPDAVTAIVVGPGASGTGYGFGALAPSSLSGVAYADANDDGIRQAGESALGNVAIALTGTDDNGAAVSRTTTTAADGSYSFGNLRPGTYALAATTPAGYLVGKAAAGTAGGAAGFGSTGSIALPQGTASTGNNFGELAPAALAGSVFVDANDDGIRQGSEPGIPSVTIALTGTDDRGNAVSLTTTTASDGSYSFGTLRPGTYTLAETPPASRLDGKAAAGTLGGTVGPDTITGIAVGPGAAGTGYTFARLDPASFAGSVFRDDNNDGAQSPPEPGLPGVGLTLSGTDDLGRAVLISTQTAADGSYSFGNFRPGTYAVAVGPPAGYLDGKETPGNLGGTILAHQIGGVTLAPASAATGYTFAELVPSRVDGLAFRDDNNDGTRQGGEPGLAGVAFALTGADDLGNPVNLTTTTAADGTFAFAGLRPSGPAGYAIAEASPAGYLDGKVVAGPAGGTVSGRRVAGVVLGPNADAAGYSFASLAPASLAGLAYFDANNNGTPDAGEPGLAGASVALTGTDDLGHAVSLSTATASGAFAFGNLRPGTYALAMTPPAGYLDGKDVAGTLGGDASVQNRIGSIAVAPGNAGTGYNFAELLPGTIAGVIYFDANDDGARQPSDPGRAGASVTLTGTDDRGNAVSLTATSLGDGSYSFNGLRPGTYAVAEVPPAGELDGHANPGTLGGAAASARQINGIVLGSNQASLNNNFGVLDPATISGSVYVDSNDDGAREPGEVGLQGVAMTLSGTDDLGHAVSATVNTAADGTFAFPGLRPGTYAVVETRPAGSFDGTIAVGTAGGTAGPLQVGNIALAAGRTSAGNLFARLLPSSLSGVVFDDRNDDGVQGAGESGLANVALALTGTDDLGAAVSLTTATAADGTYSFANLRPGSYRVVESPPAGTLDGIIGLGTLGGTPGTNSVAVVVPEGTNATGTTFARLRPSTVSGLVYADANDDGIPQPAEAGLPGVAVTLTGVDDRGNAVSIPLTAGAGGAYSFANLRPGTYAVAVVPPAGYLDGKIAVGTAGGTAGTRRIGSIVAAPGTAAAGYDFAELVASSLSGVAFDDRNDDGIEQPGEAGLLGVVITLTGTDDNGAAVNQATATAADGSYSFANLRPGTYRIVAGPVAPYLDGLTTPGLAGGSASGRSIAGIGLGQGAAGTGNNFASLAPAGLSGFVYGDSNDDGAYEPGEPGIAGVVVTLSGTDDRGAAVSQSRTTDANGQYRFDALRPGTYTLTETPPSADFDGAIAVGSSGGTAGAHQVGSIALHAGVGGSGYLFGEVPPATLGGSVFDDANDDGIRQPGESGLAGATVTLTGVDNRGNPVRLTTTAAADGSYSFPGLRPGTYGIAGSPPSGYLIGKTSGVDCTCNCPDGLSKVVVAAGNAFGAEQVGMIRPSYLAGSVYFDANRDGARQPGEAGQAGVAITFDGTDDLGRVVSMTTMTDADGNYRFDNLRPGRYTLADLSPAVYSGGTVAVGAAGGTPGPDVVVGIAPAPGTAGTGYDFAVLGATIAGRVAQVLDDGSTAGPGIGGAVVTLEDASGRPIGSTTTAADGSYSFSNLAAGNYRLALATPAGYANATPAVRSATLPLGGIGNQDFGLTAGSIAGTVYVDRAAHGGAPQAGDPGLDGVLVTLDGVDLNNNHIARTTRTADGGAYRFFGLVAGTYSVSIPGLGGYLTEAAAAGTIGGSAGTERVDAIAVDPTSAGTGYDFPEIIPSSIAGVGYLIVDPTPSPGASSLVASPGGPGLPGELVTLTGTDLFGRAVSRSMPTAADGSYAFGDLYPGRYALGIITDPAYAAVQAQPGSVGGSAQPAVIRTVDLGPGVAATAYNFPAIGSPVTGVVFQDLLNSGDYAAGDPGIAGATVALIGADGRVVATTTTDRNGRYAFAGIAAGSYTVRATYNGPDGASHATVRALALQAGAPGIASFPAVATPTPAPALGAITGNVYADLLDSGVPAYGDYGLAGVTVTLAGIDPSGRAFGETTTTNAAGFYTFNDLPAGTYAVAIATPAGFLADRLSPSLQLVEVAAGGLATPTFGVVPPASIGGVVYLDADRNGTFQGNDFGVANVVVTLAGTDDLGHAVVERATTDADGRYAFAGLRPGAYSVTRGPSPALADGPTNVGNLGGSVSGLRAGPVALIGGSTGQGYDFAQRVKPGCLLTLPQIRRAVEQGPYPASLQGRSVTYGATTPKLPHRSYPSVVRYLPRLANRIGVHR